MLALFLTKYQKQILVGAAILMFALINALAFIKYRLNLYNAIDLAYFNQVFWNTTQGNFFLQTIHPHLSLGDHAELIIPILAIPYAIFKDPRTLIVLQTLALITPAFLIYRIAKLVNKNLVPLGLALLYLINPLVTNAALFEFHVLVFAIIPLLFAIDAYLRENKIQFLISIIIALLVREDVALITAGFSLLALIDKRDWWWKIIPGLISGIYFILIMKLIAAFSLANGYKFKVYYAQFGTTPFEILKTFLFRPLVWLKQIFSFKNLELIISLLLPFVFIPLAAKKYLSLALLPFLEFALGSGGASMIIQTHYATLFFPALSAATIVGLPKFTVWIKRLTVPAPIIIAATSLWVAFYFGPYLALPTLAKNYQNLDQLAAEAQSLINSLPTTAACAASYELLPKLSGRRSIYSIHYIALGVTQFAQKKYPVPTNLEYTIMNVDDPLIFKAQFSDSDWAKPYADSFQTNLENSLGRVVAKSENYVVFKKSSAVDTKFWTKLKEQQTNKKYSVLLNKLGAIEVIKN